MIKHCIPLASTANKHGRVIADHMMGIPARYAPVEGTSVLQAYDFILREDSQLQALSLYKLSYLFCNLIFV